MNTRAKDIIDSLHDRHSIKAAATGQCDYHFAGMEENEIYCFADDSRLSIPYAEDGEIEEI